VVDNFSRECLAGVVDTSLAGVRVVRELERLVCERGIPEVIVSDNGTELTSRGVLRWATGRLDWHYIEPGKPVQNALYGPRPRASHSSRESAELGCSRISGLLVRHRLDTLAMMDFRASHAASRSSGFVCEP
jgi:transposase InsO family protein